MLKNLKSTVSSRQFQTGVAQFGAAVVSIVVSSLVSKAVNTALNSGIELVMDKIHGTETPAE